MKKGTRSEKRPPKETEEKPWVHETIGDVVLTDTTFVRFQVSISPDGHKFIGMRKFAIKKDGTEQVTKDGLTLPFDDAILHDLSKMMLTRVLSHVQSHTKAPPNDKGRYCVKIGEKYLTKSGKITSKLLNAAKLPRKEAEVLRSSRGGARLVRVTVSKEKS